VLRQAGSYPLMATNAIKQMCNGCTGAPGRVKLRLSFGMEEMAEFCFQALKALQVLIVRIGGSAAHRRGQCCGLGPAWIWPSWSPQAVHEYQSGWIPAGAGLLALEQTPPFLRPA